MMSRFQKQTPQDRCAKPAASILACSATHKQVPDISQQQLSPSAHLPKDTLGRERAVWESETAFTHRSCFWGKHTALNVISVKLSLNSTPWLASVNTQTITVPLHTCKEFAHAHTPLLSPAQHAYSHLLQHSPPKVSWRSEKAGWSKL